LIIGLIIKAMKSSPEAKAERQVDRNRRRRNASFLAGLIFESPAFFGLAFGFELLRGSAERRSKSK
jgi:hypothetical protein